MAKKKKAMTAQPVVETEVVKEEIKEVKPVKKFDIKETLDITQVLKECCYTFGKVSADGSYNRSDLSRFIELGLKLDMFIEAFSGATVAIDEMKDLDSAEIAVLIGEIHGCIKRFNEGKKGL